MSNDNFFEHYFPLVVTFVLGVFLIITVMIFAFGALNDRDKEEQLKQDCINYINNKHMYAGYFDATLEYECKQSQEVKSNSNMVIMPLPMVIR